MRLAHYVIGYIDAVYALLYSDDGKIIGRTAHYERGILLFLFVLICVGIPISWRKVRGGERTEWIGYLVDVGRFEMGISMSRAAWASSWCLDKATEGSVRLGELREGLGRLQFIAGPIETLRPFLGPLYAWCCAGPRYSKPRLLIMVRLILKILVGRIEGAPHHGMREEGMPAGRAFPP